METVQGCTHYPILKGIVREVLGTGIALIDPAEEVTKEVFDFLLQRDLLNSKGGDLDIYLTDAPPHYVESITRFLGESVNNIMKAVRRENYEIQIYPVVSRIREERCPLGRGKGANLRELSRLGVSGPPGFCVTAEAYNPHSAL